MPLFWQNNIVPAASALFAHGLDTLLLNQPLLVTFALTLL